MTQRVIKLKTRVFRLYEDGGKYENLTALARAMGLHYSYIYRVKRGERGIHGKFIVGAIRAFPGYKLDDLFYVAPEGSKDD